MAGEADVDVEEIFVRSGRGPAIAVDAADCSWLQWATGTVFACPRRNRAISCDKKVGLLLTLDGFTVREHHPCRTQSTHPRTGLFIEAQVALRTEHNDVIQRLLTIPGIGMVCATSIYALVGDIRRFPNARALASYAGLVPSVRQSGDSNQHGGITREGCNYLRAALVQAAHIVTRPRAKNAEPIQAVYARIRGSRGRRKVALVAVARHLLRIAFHFWRDGTSYDPDKLRCPSTT